MDVPRNGFQKSVVAVVAAILLMVASIPAQGAPPAGKKYAVVLLVTDPETGEVGTERGCAIFAATEWCTENDECGPWEITEDMGALREITLSVQLEEEGELIDVVGYGFTERRGRKSSIGGTLLYTLDGVTVNAGIAGTQTNRGRCLEWAESDE